MRELQEPLIILSRELSKWVLPTKRRNNIFKSNNKHRIKTCIVLGSGGHTMEMLQLLDEIDFNIYCPRFYIISSGDILSSNKVKEFEDNHSKGKEEAAIENVEFFIRYIPRSRKVGQSWFSTVFTVLNTLMVCCKLILSELPDLIICNGPGNCVPVCMISYIPRVLGIKWIRLIYIESFARVHTLSLSGKLLLRFVDKFLVQWPYLVNKYPQAEYKGILV
ncbi:9731_t:CDS:2 [Entrophospora sp. SA101]|nr:9731_t:CDS:2 [Entrophospora sp. SA101]